MLYFRTNAIEDKQEKSGSKAVQGKCVRTLSLYVS